MFHRRGKGIIVKFIAPMSWSLCNMLFSANLLNIKVYRLSFLVFILVFIILLSQIYQMVEIEWWW